MNEDVDGHERTDLETGALDRTVGVRFVGIAALILLAASVAFAVGRMFTQFSGRGLTPWWANVLGAIAMGAVWLWYRRAPAERADGTVVVVAGTGLASLVIPAFYGMHSTIWWLPLVGFATVLAGTEREAWTWGVLSIVSVVVLVFVAPHLQVSGAAGESTLEVAMSRIVFAALVLAVAAGFRRVVARRTREVAEARKQAERSSRAKSTFLAQMSHEMRTPLNAVIGMLDVSMRETTSARIRDQLQTANTSAQLLLQMIQDLLDTTRGETEPLELRSEPFSIHRVVSDVLQGLRKGASDKGLTFTATAAEDLAEWRVGDGLRLAQILLNLVTNAIKFTDIGSVSVELSAASADGVKITVTDTGCGISQAEQPLVWEPFLQVGTSASRHAGTGLGLAIVKSLVGTMGGSVTLESSPGEGSTFRVELPLPVRDGDQTSPPPPTDLLQERSWPALSEPERAPCSAHVLTVDDTPANHGVLSAMLEAIGCSVESALNGEEALAALTRSSFDVMLLDLEMPGMSGLDVVRHIRQMEDHSGQCVIMVSAHADPGTRAAAMDAGADGYLCKPLRLAELTQGLSDVQWGRKRASPDAPAKRSGVKTSGNGSD